MHVRALALGLSGVVLLAVSAPAAEQMPTLAFGVDGSISLNNSDTTYRNPKGRSDYLTSPYLRLSASGKLAPDLSYSFYASAGFEKYPFRQDEDNTFATLGTSLTKKWGDAHLGVSYERNNNFDGVFGHFTYVSNDVGINGRYSYVNAEDTVRIKPGFNVSRRFADDLSEDSFIYSFKLDAERKIIEKWWWTLTPRIRRQHYLAGENEGRVDTIYSITTGLRYTISDHFQLSAGFGYSHRDSTVVGKAQDSFTIGISLDFSHTFAKLHP